MCAKSPIPFSIQCVTPNRLLECRACVRALGQVVPRAYLRNPATLATQGCTQLSTIPSNSKGV